MMKKILLFSLLAITLSLHVQGQEIYVNLYRSAIEVTNDPDAPESSVKLNHFYVTALNYLKSMVESDDENEVTTMLDNQAYYLSEFVSSFFQNVSKAHSLSAEKQHSVVMVYVHASLDNPLFKDKDEEKVHAFVLDKNSLTPFSLDTDWEKAYKKVDKKMKKLF